MKFKAILPVFAVIAALAIGVSLSSFTDKTEPKKTGATLFFEYTGGVGGYDIPGNWQYLPSGNPTVSPCDPGTDIACVLRVNEDDLSGTGTLAEQVADFLDNYPGGAEMYADDPSNTPHRKE